MELTESGRPDNFAVFCILMHMCSMRERKTAEAARRCCAEGDGRLDADAVQRVPMRKPKRRGSLEMARAVNVPRSP